MRDYWFAAWLTEQRASDEASLRKAFDKPNGLESLLRAAPAPRVQVRQGAPDRSELSAGKGIDLTGELGCRHVDCLSREIEGLFRHAWHYFDAIRLPDQALYHVTGFNDHGDVDDLIAGLVPFVLVLEKLRQSGGADLIEFEIRTPSCQQHLADHAREANIAHAFANTDSLVNEIANSGTIEYEPRDTDGHRHLGYRLDHPAFEHSEWGSLCARRESIPRGEGPTRRAIAGDVVRKYMAALSADALGARRSHTALGTAVPFYRRLLATHPSPTADDVAFELALPISPTLPVEALINLRKEEHETFQRFQDALRAAIAERLRMATSEMASEYAREIKRDVIDPALRKIRDKLVASDKLALRSAAGGVGLGVVAATVGLLSPLAANPIGVGLAVGGAITLGAASLKKANDDMLSVRNELSLSDMYFLWKAREH